MPAKSTLMVSINSNNRHNYSFKGTFNKHVLILKKICIFPIEYIFLIFIMLETSTEK